VKFLLFIFASILIYSCQPDSSTGRQAKAGFGIWKINDSTVQIHKYNKAGLLDSTLKIWYHCKNGKSDLRFTSLVTREYDSLGELTAEKFFDFSSHSKKWNLTGSIIKKYDKKGNLLLEVEHEIKDSRNTMSRLDKSWYNSNNQQIIRLEVRKNIEPDPDNWTIDSVLAHSNDAQAWKYDTTIIKYSYDESGNLVTATYGSPENPTEQVLTSIYSNGIKQRTVSTTADGDTDVIYKYEKDGELIRETVDYRTQLPYSLDTSWHKGNNVIKRISYDTKSHFKLMQLFKYDEKGNQIVEITYR
jgi:hypothetical protein